MKKGSKNTLIISGLLLTAGLVLTYRKASLLSYAFDKMEISPVLIDNIKLGWTQSSCSLDVMIKNNSSEIFDISGGGFAYLKRIEIIFNNQTIGVAQVQMEEISIPPYGNMVLKNIPLLISTGAIVNNLTAFKQLISQAKFIGYIDVLGTEYQIG